MAEAVATRRVPGKVTGIQTIPKTRGVVSRWNEPTAWSDGSTDDFTEDTVQRYDVELWRAGAMVDDARVKGNRKFWPMTKAEAQLNGYKTKVFAVGVDGDATDADPPAGDATPEDITLGNIDGTVSKAQMGTLGISRFGTTTAMNAASAVDGDLWINTSFSPSRIYRRVGGTWVYEVPGDVISDATLGLTKFASTARPVAIVGTLPTLPDAQYPNGAPVVLTTDGKLYRNVSGVWTRTSPTTDLSGQVTSTQITDGAITTLKLGAGAVTAGTIAADTITAGQIQAGAISTSELATNAITSVKIAAGQIITTHMVAGSIHANRLTSGTVIADAIVAGAIDGNSINGVTITGGTIRTASSGNRVQMTNAARDRIVFYNDAGSEAGTIEVPATGDARILIGGVGYMQMFIPLILGNVAPGTISAGGAGIYRHGQNNALRVKFPDGSVHVISTVEV